MSRTLRKAPEVRITPESVLIGNDRRHFQNGSNKLQQIDLRDEGDVNILSIRYENKGMIREIRVPVPKGKLREAIVLQERLQTTTG